MSSGLTADIDLSGQDRGTTSSCHGPAVSKAQPKVLLSRPPADGLIMPTGSDPQSVQSYCLASGARVYNPGQQTLTNNQATVFHMVAGWPALTQRCHPTVSNLTNGTLNQWAAQPTNRPYTVGLLSTPFPALIVPYPFGPFRVDPAHLEPSVGLAKFSIRFDCHLGPKSWNSTPCGAPKSL